MKNKENKHFGRFVELVSRASCLAAFITTRASCLFFCLVPLSCTTTLTPSQYLNYYEKNRSRFTKVIERNDVKATVAYMPVEYYVARDLQSDRSLSLDSTYQRYKNSLFFVVGIKGKKYQSGSVLLERQGYPGFKESVVRNTFDRNQDIFLLRGNDTVNVSGYNYTRNWGVGNDDMFVITFAKKSIRENIGKYRLLIRELTPELGTLDISLNELCRNTKQIKG